jgi:peptidoglycan hydrolase-like protein with peptidoglycan-binding domain
MAMTVLTGRRVGGIAVTAALAAVIAGVPGSAALASPAATTSAATSQAGAAAAQALQPWPVLRQGHNSSWPPVTVRSLQYLLNARGAHLAIDGSFGAKTKAAVIAFQRHHGLSHDGVAGAATWRALVTTVQHGSKGPAVRAVQDQVNFRNNKNGRTLNVDGSYGAKTQAAVRAFQKAMSHEVAGFTVDGIVGRQTWQALVTEALSG